MKEDRDREESYIDMSKTAWIYCGKCGHKIYLEIRFYPKKDNLAVITQTFHTRFALRNKVKGKKGRRKTHV